MLDSVWCTWVWMWLSTSRLAWAASRIGRRNAHDAAAMHGATHSASAVRPGSSRSITATVASVTISAWPGPMPSVSTMVCTDQASTAMRPIESPTGWVACAVSERRCARANRSPARP